MRPILVVLIACGLGASVLLGWAVAYYYDKKSQDHVDERDSDS